MPQNWNSINDLYFVKSPAKAATKPEEAEEEQKKKDTGPEVRLSEGKFIAGSEGFQFNKKCKVKVKVDYLKTTNRKKVTFKLFVVYNNEEEDLAHQVDGYEENGYTEAEMTLFYGEKYNQALQQDPGAKCSYKFKASHSKGKKEIESELIEMPNNEKNTTFIIQLNIDPNDEEANDDSFRLFSTNKKYDTTLTVKNDRKANNNILDLDFINIDPNLFYSLEVNPGKDGKPYFLFENISYKEFNNA